MLLGSRVKPAREYARMMLLTVHGGDAVDAYLREVYGTRLEREVVMRGLAVMDEGLLALYPGERQSLIDWWEAEHPPTPHEEWLERCLAYAETELAADLGLPVPLPDQALERYAHQWAMLLCHAVTTLFPEPEVGA